MIVTIDYIIPREIYNHAIDDLKVDNTYHPKYSAAPSYAIEIGKQTIRTDAEAFAKLKIGDTVEVQKTRILRKITSLKNDTINGEKISIYVAPFSYFPLFPILFLLPLILTFNTQDSITLMAARPLSIVVALVSLLMVLF